MPDTIRTMPKKTKAEILAEIARHARAITRHRDDPTMHCDELPLRGCAGAMIHDADDILKLLRELGVE